MAMEPISGQNIPAKYSKYLKDGVTGEDGAKKAAVSYCAENPEADCQKFLQFLDAYGYKFNTKDIITNESEAQAAAPSTPTKPVEPEEDYYEKWHLEIGLIGLDVDVDDDSLYSYHGDPKNNYYAKYGVDRLILPGIGFIRRPSYKLAWDIDLRPKIDLLRHDVSFESGFQVKYTVLHNTCEISPKHDAIRINLGIGLTNLLNIYWGHGSAIDDPDLLLVKNNPSRESREMIGAKITVEMEIEQSGAFEFGLSRLTNLEGKSIYMLGMYLKMFYAPNSKAPFHDGNYSAPSYGMPSGIGSMGGGGRGR